MIRYKQIIIDKWAKLSEIKRYSTYQAQTYQTFINQISIRAIEL